MSAAEATMNPGSPGMGPARRRLFLGVSLLVASLGLGVIAFADIGENLVYYWDPGQVLANRDKAVGADIRLGGLVQAGSLDWTPGANELKFVVTDVTGQHTLPVHATGAPPLMFREGIGVVVEGTMTEGGVFESDRLMVKHSNEYRAPVEGQDPKELYKTVEDM